MSPRFGTSGLRGLVTDLTDPLVTAYVRAFISACNMGRAVHVGWDLRPSSPDIAEAVIKAICAAGLPAVSHGAVPTPALALASMANGAAAVMITGSHIPADRNGLKFYLPGGEVSKADEEAILTAYAAPAPQDAAKLGICETRTDALDLYSARYALAFGTDALKGLRIGVYEHSSVARDVMGDALRALGAQSIALGRSDVFIPVDTEAVDPATRGLLNDWAKAHNLDAIVSTDGDGDRPMLADANGTIVPGDLLGPITAQVLGASRLITPVSSNTLTDQMLGFETTRTRIGSPFVIAAMEAALAQDPTLRIVGYEANGGFLLGFDAQATAGELAPLMTRDSLLPMIAPLVAMRAAQQSLETLVATLPARFTAADRVQGIDPTVSAPVLQRLSTSAEARAAFFSTLPHETAIDQTDGLRVTFADGCIVHLRPSGNAPEFRCYAEAQDPQTATALVKTHLARLKKTL